MRYKYVFFDMDGVLIDSMPFHVKSWIRALNKYDIDVEADELMRLGGVPFRDIIKVLADKSGKNLSEEDIQNIYDMKLDYFVNHFKADVYDGIYDLLDFLKEKGVKIALVSGALSRAVSLVIEKYFEGRFDLILSADDYEKGKPNPDPYLIAYDSLKCVDKGECLVIEDAVMGVKSGKSAGFDVFALETTLERELLVEAGANEIFKTQRDMLNWFLDR